MLPQAALDTEVCMEILQGFERFHDVKIHVLKLLRTVYGLKHSNCNFQKKLSTTLESRIILQCSTYSCVHASKNLILVTCVHDALIFSKNNIWIDMLIRSLFNVEENFELKNEGNIENIL